MQNISINGDEEYGRDGGDAEMQNMCGERCTSPKNLYGYEALFPQEAYTRADRQKLRCGKAMHARAHTMQWGASTIGKCTKNVRIRESEGASNGAIY